MSGIFVGSSGPTSRTTSGLGHISRSARMLRWRAPSNRRAASWCEPKSAVCTTATNGKPPDRLWLRWACDCRRTWRSACERIGRHLHTEFDRLGRRSPTRGRTVAFLGDLIALAIVCRRVMAMDSLLARVLTRLFPTKRQMNIAATFAYRIMLSVKKLRESDRKI